MGAVGKMLERRTLCLKKNNSGIGGSISLKKVFDLRKWGGVLKNIEKKNFQAPSPHIDSKIFQVPSQ